MSAVKIRGRAPFNFVEGDMIAEEIDCDRFLKGREHRPRVGTRRAADDPVRASRHPIVDRHQCGAALDDIPDVVVMRDDDLGFQTIDYSVDRCKAHDVLRAVNG